MRRPVAAATQAQIEAQNQAAGPDVFVQEGAILLLSTVETAAYWKCKPPSIEEIHWQADQQISKEIVRQALLKLLENGYDFAAGRAEDVQAAREHAARNGGSLEVSP